MFCKKRKGVLGNLASTAICMLVIVSLIILFMDVMNVLDYKSQIDQIGRKYILVLETTGTISSNIIENEIKTLGYNDITVVVNEGNNSEVPYGNEVKLEITVKATPDEIGLFTSNLLGESEYPAKCKKVSISKAR